MATNNSINTTSGKITLEKAASDLQTTYIGGSTWSTGQDNTDNSFRISQNATLGTSDTFVMSSAGIRTLPLQSSFSANVGTALANITGDGTIVIIPFTSEFFDINSDFSTPNFIAPVTGNYFFTTCLYFTGILATHTNCYIYINATSCAYRLSNINFAPGQFVATGIYTISGSVIMRMTVGDIADVRVRFIGGNKVVGIDNTAGRSFFSGYLIG